MLRMQSITFVQMQRVQMLPGSIGVTSGTQLAITSVCDNGWIEVSYEDRLLVSSDYVSAVAADGCGRKDWNC